MEKMSILVVLAGVLFAALARALLAQNRRIALLDRKVAFLLKNHAVPYFFNDAATPEMRRLVENGRMIEAIKLYRQLRPVGLREAKKAVEKLAS